VFDELEEGQDSEDAESAGDDAPGVLGGFGNGDGGEERGGNNVANTTGPAPFFVVSDSRALLEYKK
jgi:hypothetical protein